MKCRNAKKLMSLLLSVIAAAALMPWPSAAALTARDPYYGKQWALKNDGSFTASANGISATQAAERSTPGIDIDIESAWSTYKSGRQVVVAIIDTGVDISNPDLADHIWVNTDETPGNGIDDDGNGFVDDINGWNFRDNNSVLHISGADIHGTHCCGTIAADCNDTGIAGICGYTDNVKVMVLKTFDGSSALGKTSDIIRAIRYAEANGASIVNLSLGFENYSDGVYQAIKSSKMLFIAAAGNKGSDTALSPLYPAAYDLNNIISVANLNYDGNLSSSSNYGSSVDIAAPGTTIIGYGGENSEYYMSGTSMSAPMVTGVAALTYSYFQTATLSQVRQIILDTAAPLSTLSGKVATGGMLDAGAALKYGGSIISGRTYFFSDVRQSDWFYKYVTDLARSGVVSGYGDGTFRPRNSVTVGESLRLIMAGAGYGAQPATDSHWASGYRDKALSLGIVSAGDVSDLNASATRMFIAQTAAKALGLTPDDSVSPFSDVSDPYVTALYNAGVISGSTNSSGSLVYRPGDTIQRCEMSTVIWQMTN